MAESLRRLGDARRTVDWQFTRENQSLTTSARGIGAVDAKSVGRAASCGAFQVHDGQVFSPVMERDLEFQAGARFAARQGPGPRARRTSGPTGPGFESRAAVRRPPGMIDLVGCSPAQRGMGTGTVVPLAVPLKLPHDFLAPVGHQQRREAFGL